MCRGDQVLFRLQQAFDFFAWQSFIALNWPADPASYGKPDTQTKIGNATNSDRVWETFISPARVLKVDGAAPDTYAPVDARKNNLNAIGKRTHVLDEVDEAFFNLEKPLPPIVDNNSEYVRYEIRLNRTSYDYIVKGAQVDNSGPRYPLYSRVGQNKFLDAGGSITFPDGTIEVKVAWKKLGVGDDPQRFFTQKVDVYENPYADPVVVKKDVTFGMVGMHIMYLVEGVPQWVWPTFEHIDNAPLANMRGGKQEITGEWHVDDPKYPDNWGPTKVRASYNFFNLKPNNKKFKRSIGGFSPTSRECLEAANQGNSPDYYQKKSKRIPSQIAKVITDNNWITASKWTYALNEEIHRRLKEINPDSVWANYRLTTTQWPSDPGLTDKWQKYYNSENQKIESWNQQHPKDKKPFLKMSAGTIKAGNPAPVSLGNAVAETYMQINGSCMNCHSGATFGGTNGKQADANFSFLLQRAGPIPKQTNDQREVNETKSHQCP